MPVYIRKSGDLVGWHRCLTQSQTTEYRATQLFESIKFKLCHAISQWKKIITATARNQEINSPSFGKYESSHNSKISLSRESSRKLSLSSFAFSSRSLKIMNLDLVAKPEIEGNYSRFCLKAWNQVSGILASFWCARLNKRNSHSHLEIEKMLLIMLWSRQHSYLGFGAPYKIPRHCLSTFMEAITFIISLNIAVY